MHNVTNIQKQAARATDRSNQSSVSLYRLRRTCRSCSTAASDGPHVAVRCRCRCRSASAAVEKRAVKAGRNTYSLYISRLYCTSPPAATPYTTQSTEDIEVIAHGLRAEIACKVACRFLSVRNTHSRDIRQLRRVAVACHAQLFDYRLHGLSRTDKLGIIRHTCSRSADVSLSCKPYIEILNPQF